MLKSAKVALGFLTAMFATVLAVFYFLFCQTNYLEYRNIPFPPQMATVAAGSVAPLSVERCNLDSRSHNYLTTHALRNVKTGLVILMPDVTITIDPGCTRAVSRINLVPDATPPGRYYIYGTAETKGTIRTFHLPWHSQEFDVVDKTPVVVKKLEAPKKGFTSK